MARCEVFDHRSVVSVTHQKSSQSEAFELSKGVVLAESASGP